MRSLVSELSELLVMAIMILCLILPAEGRAREVPARVVSLNLCTDQLLLLLAEPAQVASLTFLAVDSVSSLMASEAAGYRLNRGRAEEVLELQPDLVLAGPYGARETVHLLQRLGYPVETIDDASTFEEIRANLRRVGDLLGTKEKAMALISAMDKQLDSQPVPGSHDQLVASTFGVNGYVAGKGTLFAAVASAAGFQTLGHRLNFEGYRHVSLEAFLVAGPDVIDPGYAWDDPPALASAYLKHPALKSLLRSRTLVDFPPATWNCGLPQLADAVVTLRQVRRDQTKSAQYRQEQF
ncbi:MAG: ABC transporter substrate-binding protein [Gammaproteobacteria bacterium]|nr:ABC transporter substrate-binding protein [Gammaproteobacteria bacterium]